MDMLVLSAAWAALANLVADGHRVLATVPSAVSSVSSYGQLSGPTSWTPGPTGISHGPAECSPMRCQRLHVSGAGPKRGHAFKLPVV